jgi:hypothetical protein
MQHLDEGTIHAWLDGALDATRSREIEAHLATCSTCSAAVAEARGLIAASSRILTALDDVPGGVLPKRAPAVPAKPAKRQWRAAPWVSAIAATLMLAVGLATWNSGTPVLQTKEDAATPLMDAQVAAPRVDTMAAVANVPAQERAVPPAAAPLRRDAADEKRLNRTKNVESNLATTGRAAGVVGGAAAPARNEPPTVAAAEPELKKAVVADTATSRRLDASTKLEAVVTTGAAEGSRQRTAQPQLAVGQLPSSPAALAGCYRVNAEAPTAVAGAAAATDMKARGAATSRAADRAAPSAQSYAGPTLEVVRLDTAQKALGYPVLLADSTVVGWWRRLSPDTAHVRLLRGVTFLVAGKNRVDCP